MGIGNNIPAQRLQTKIVVKTVMLFKGTVSQDDKYLILSVQLLSMDIPYFIRQTLLAIKAQIDLSTMAVGYLSIFL